jgi:hypothetical protein
VQHVGFAAHLAVLDVQLVETRRRIHRGLIPFAASGTLESRNHETCPWLLVVGRWQKRCF